MSINQIHQFLNKENIQVLWDVLIEDPIVKNFCSSHDKIIELTKIYESNLKGFYDIERKNCNSLIELNKKYILIIINYLNSKMQTSNKTFTNTQHNTQQQIKKIIIHDEIKQPITYEEIQNERKSQFEKDLYSRQQEFTTAMSNPVPPVPNFSDKIDEPISEIELEIKKILEQRSYDMEIINKNSQNNYQNNYQNNITSPKTINSIIKDDDKSNKHISWADDKPETPSSFFEKLKKVDSSVTSDIKNNLGNKDTSISDELNYLKNEVMNLNNKLNMLMAKMDKMD